MKILIIAASLLTAVATLSAPASADPYTVHGVFGGNHYGR